MQCIWMTIGCTLPLMYDNDQEEPIWNTFSNGVVHIIVIVFVIIIIFIFIFTIVIIIHNQLSLLLPLLLLLLLYCYYSMSDFIIIGIWLHAVALCLCICFAGKLHIVSKTLNALLNFLYLTFFHYVDTQSYVS